HENEMAQTLAAGWKSANVWMHSAWVTSKGEKMSKSLGNGLSVPSVLAQKSAWVVRYALGGVQYRAMLEWSDQSLNEAQSAYDRISNFLERAGRVIENQPDYAEVQGVDADNLPEDFTKAMNDDINVSGALAAIFTAIRSGNALLDDYAQSQDNSQNDSIKNLLKTCVLQVRAMLDTLGLDPYSPQWRSNAQKSQDLGEDADNGASAEHKALESLITNQLEQRAIARAAKDFARADAIRDSLTAAGVVIEDSAQGSSWHLS
ncbi:DALR domain protein, partial [Gardnerella pickettii JCP7659]